MSLRNKQDLWSRQNWSQPHLQPQQISASRRSVTSALKTVQLCAGRDNRNRSGCRSTSGCMRSEFKGDLLQMEVRNLQGTRHVLSRAKRDIQQTQLIPGSVISCIEISNKESQRARENYNFGEKPLNPKVNTVLCAYQMHVSIRSTNWERDSLLQHAYSSPHDGRTSYSFSGLFPFKLRGAEKAPCPSVPLSKRTRWHTYSIPWIVFCGYCCLAAAWQL